MNIGLSRRQKRIAISGNGIQPQAGDKAHALTQIAPVPHARSKGKLSLLYARRGYDNPYAVRIGIGSLAEPGEACRWREGLPGLGTDPQLLLGAAKALFFVDRGHLDLAANLTEQAFENSTAFSAVFAMKAQFAASCGELDNALELYDRAIEMGEQGGQFHIYLLILKATVLLAGKRRIALKNLLSELTVHNPAAAVMLSPFFVSPHSGALPDNLEQTFSSLSPKVGHDMLFHLDRTAARFFGQTSHRRNVLAGFATHLLRHHGAAAIPRQLTPLLFSRGLARD